VRCAFGLAIALRSPWAAAQPALAVHLDYEAHEGCPNQRAFLDGFERSRKVVMADAEARVPHLTVRITRQADGSHGQVMVRDVQPPRPRTSVLTREVVGSTCEEVVQALVFVTIMLLDAQSIAPLRVSPAPPESPRSKPSPGRDSVAARRVEPEPKPASRPPPDLAFPVPDTPREFAARLAASAMVSTVFGAPALGLGLLTELPLALSPRTMARLMVSYQADAPAIAMGQAELAWIVAGISGCWLGFASPLWWNLGLCASLEGGEVVAKGSLSGGRNLSRTAPWLGDSVSALVAAYPTRPLFLEIEAGVTLSLLRHDFVFRDHESLVSLREQPLFGTWGRLAMGVRIP
jgi:hypothetical protein